MQMRLLLIGLILILFGALLPNTLIARAEPQTATTYYVNGTTDPTPGACTVRSGGGYDCPSLRTAVIAANANFGRDTILLHHNTTYQLTIQTFGTDDATKGDLDFTDDVTFDYTSLCFFGTCGATIQGGAGFNDRLLEVYAGAEVDLTNVTFRNGYNVYNQGGAIMNSGVLTLNSGLVISNVAQSGGGIFNFDPGVLYLIDTQVTSNTAKVANGGGLRNDGTAYLTDTQFDLNYADEQGGAIANGGPLVVSGGIISGNIAHDGNTSLYSGGGIFTTEPGWLIMTGTQVISNVAEYGGGGVANEYGRVFLTDVTLAHNRVTFGWGGGLDTYGDVTLMRTAILSNSANYGGGVSLINGVLTATNITVVGNNADASGGGLYSPSPSKAYLNYSQIASNTSTSDGGGIYNGGWVSMLGSTVYHNRGRDGGGFHNKGTALLGNDTLSGNYANDGGGGFFNTDPASVAYLDNVTIANNRANYDGDAAGQGGGLRVVTGTVFVYNTLIAQNIDSNITPHFDCSGLITGNHDLIQTTTGCAFNGVTSGNVTGQTPQIRPLQDNGGSTWTHALSLNSPARNAGNSDGAGFSGCLSADQRDVLRGARCDIGAFEIAQMYLPAVMK